MARKRDPRDIIARIIMRNRRASQPSRHFKSLLVVLVVAVTAALSALQPSARRVSAIERRSVSASAPTASAERAFVARAVDGDTLKLAGGERVRLIGIDTPELHESAKLHRDAERTGQDVRTIKQMGEAAYQFTRRLVEGKEVRLEFDVQPRDRYGRLLAYIYLDNGLFVNAEIIRQGYAYPMVIPPNTRHADEFRQLFNEARRLNRGLWAEGAP